MNQEMTTLNQGNKSENATFQVVLKGLRQEANPSEARVKLAALFKASPEQINQLLLTPSYIVKKALTFDVASKYKSAIDAAGGACELFPEEEPVISIHVDLPNVGSLAKEVEVENKGSAFGKDLSFGHSSVPSSTGHAVSGDAKEKSAQGTQSKIVLENLGVLKHKISKNNAYLGVLVGMAVFAFSFFLSWVSIPAGQMARDGGSATGWHEKAYFALLPLAYALYPVALQKSVQLKNLIINIVIAFVLLGYNNVANRTTWHNDYGNMGSTLDAGFWMGFLAMVVISACGIAWSLHTVIETENLEKVEN